MIQYAILGLLSWQPATGYDLKQIFRSSLTMYWAGSNNQIYRTLVKLHEDELVSLTVEEPDAGPSRKVYTITPAGKAALRDWLLSPSELPDIKNSFLIKVEWADQLSDEELDNMLAKYQEEVSYRWIMQNEYMEREAQNQPNRTARERLLWESVNKNWVMAYQREMEWVEQLRTDLQKLSKQKPEGDVKDKPYKFTF